jgi:hypothetical protein
MVLLVRELALQNAKILNYRRDKVAIKIAASFNGTSQNAVKLAASFRGS